MWTFSVAHQHKLLLVWTRRWHKPASLPGVGSQFASYRVSAALRRPEDRSITPGAKRRSRVLNTSGVPHKSVVSDGRQHGERSTQTRGWKNEPPVLQTADQWRGGNSRVSSELRKLCLEDFPAERERPGRHKPALDHKAEDYEIVFGVSPCLLALTQGRRKARKLFVKDEEASQRTSVLTVCEEAHRRGVQVQRVTKKDLDKMSSGRVHQGVCLQASPLSYLTEDSAPSRKGSNAPLWLVLEKIQDPMNLGAILRSAYFLGVDRVASSLHHSCPLSPVVSKASSGVMEAMGVYGYENLQDMVKVKVAQGWQVVGTVGSEAGAPQIPVTQCSDFKMTKPTLLLMGSEGEGLSQQLLSLCQTLLTIPAGRELSPGIESLNVSVATGILLHSLLSSR
ncbi:rRNA methyltransferase 1, mitochondrial [Pempheris klunzingeri]|uniref:rRNA methyltransferase 1, mitochondrial n=1 Tax=Pempheris klunzingeri TaxID=3127111 RepID=UPI0039804EBF